MRSAEVGNLQVVRTARESLPLENEAADVNAKEDADEYVSVVVHGETTPQLSALSNSPNDVQDKMTFFPQGG